MKTDNELIAEFMGSKINKEVWGGSGSLARTWVMEDHINSDGNIFYGDEMEYKTSYDWIMPVVHKIYDTADIDVKEINNEGLAIFELGLTTPIDTIYSEVVEYIKWYNENKKDNGIQ